MVVEKHHPGMVYSCVQGWTCMIGRRLKKLMKLVNLSKDFFEQWVEYLVGSAVKGEAW